MLFESDLTFHICLGPPIGDEISHRKYCDVNRFEEESAADFTDSVSGPSRGAAIECSPGASPGFWLVMKSAPEGRQSVEKSFAPTGLDSHVYLTPRLTPWATFCRRSAAGRDRRR